MSHSGQEPGRVSGLGKISRKFWLRKDSRNTDHCILWALILLPLLLFLSISPVSAETRSLKLYYLHTGEREVITYKRNGKYIDSGLKKVNRFLRDWRRNEPTKMDPRLLDLVWDVYKKSGSKKYIHVISGYRSPATNKLLRKRGRGVAKKSQHTRGKALDFFLPDVKLSKLRAIGLKMGLGGVGFYPKSGSPFIHLDTGRVRHWPRMSRKELVRVFPNGKTLHVPSDGKPLSGYEQARAIYERKINNQDKIVIAKAEEIEKKPNFFRRLLGGEDEADDLIANTTPAPTPVKTTVQPAPDQPEEPRLDQIALASLPIPETAPRSPVVASLAPREVPLPLDEEQPPVREVAFAIPVPSQRPLSTPAETVLETVAEAVPTEPPEEDLVIQQPQPNPTITVAALSPSEIEDLRQEVYETLSTGIGQGGQIAAAEAPSEDIEQTSGLESPPDNRNQDTDAAEPGSEVVVAALNPIEPGFSYTGEISVPSARPLESEPVDSQQTAELSPIEPGAISSGVPGLPERSPRIDLERLGEPTLVATLEPLEPGVRSYGLTGRPVERPNTGGDELVVAASAPLEPGSVSRGLTAIPTPSPAATSASEESQAEIAALEPIDSALSSSGETPLPESNPIRTLLALAETEIPAPSENLEPETTYSSTSEENQVLRQSLAARPVSLENFAMVDLNSNLVGKWALAADTSISGITEIRPPAYGRNAIRERPRLVLSDGFSKKIDLGEFSRFTGSSVEFLNFERFN